MSQDPNPYGPRDPRPSSAPTGPPGQGHGQPTYGRPAQPPRDAGPEASRFAVLLDLGFTQYATPLVVRVLYLLLVLFGAISWLVGIVSGFAWSGASGLAALVGGAVGMAAWILLVRVTLEFVLAIIRVAQETQAIREGLDELRRDRGRASSPGPRTTGPGRPEGA